MENKVPDNNQLPEPDQNRVVADMNIEGMPWHSKGKPLFEESKEAQAPLSKKELWGLTFNALIAALFIALVFIGGFYLFIQFCILIWFR